VNTAVARWFQRQRGWRPRHRRPWAAGSASCGCAIGIVEHTDHLGRHTIASPHRMDAPVVQVARAVKVSAEMKADDQGLGFKTMRSGIKEAADENLLTPRFYTTDFEEMEVRRHSLSRCICASPPAARCSLWLESVANTLSLSDVVGLAGSTHGTRWVLWVHETSVFVAPPLHLADTGVGLGMPHSKCSPRSSTLSWTWLSSRRR
jgi:hypothetical protein